MYIMISLTNSMKYYILLKYLHLQIYMNIQIYEYIDIYEITSTVTCKIQLSTIYFHNYYLFIYYLYNFKYIFLYFLYYNLQWIHIKLVLVDQIYIFKYFDFRLCRPCDTSRKGWSMNDVTLENVNPYYYFLNKYHSMTSYMDDPKELFIHTVSAA